MTDLRRAWATALLLAGLCGERVARGEADGVVIVTAGPAARKYDAIAGALPGPLHAVKATAELRTLASRAALPQQRKRLAAYLRGVMARQELAAVIVAAVDGPRRKPRLSLVIIPRQGAAITRSAPLERSSHDVIGRLLDSALRPTAVPSTVSSLLAVSAPAATLPIGAAPVARSPSLGRVAAEGISPGTPVGARASASATVATDADLVRPLLHESTRSSLDVSFQFMLGGRRFEYTDPITPNAVNYRLPAGPGLAISAAVFPFARTNLPVLRDLGVSGDFERSFGISSTPQSGGTSIESTWGAFDAALRYRLSPRRARWLEVDASAGYGELVFRFESSGSFQEVVPDVHYRCIRGGLDARLALGRFSLLASGGYRFVLSAGQMGERFQHASIGGVDVGLGAAVRIAGGLEARLSANYVRVFYSMNPQVGDAYVAGGALDEFLSGQAGLAYAY